MKRSILFPLVALMAVGSLPSVAFAAHWQNPDNYSRSPSGTDPVGAITFTAEFDDEDGCPYQAYSFWVFDALGNPLYRAGDPVTLQGAGVSQEVDLPDGVGVEAIRLACVDGNGDRYDSTSNLEYGTPAFTPHDPITANWQEAVHYSRYPLGTTPNSHITFSVQFLDETGCSSQLYSFWVYDGSTPVASAGDSVALDGTTLTQVVDLPDQVPVNNIRLACVDGNGDIIDTTSAYESGSPAFTPYDTSSANWQMPDNYERTESGSTPTNPVTFRANFGDETGCPYQVYSFWIFDGSGNPIGAAGPSVALVDNWVTQTVSLPDGVGIEAIRLACVTYENERYDSGYNLESGSPAFTPYDP